MDQSSLPNFLGRWAAVIFAVCAVMLAAIQFFSSYEVDRNTRLMAEKVVDNGVAGYREELTSKLYPQTSWDDAVVHLDNRFDPEWARIFIGDYFAQSSGFETAVVIGADGKAIYARERGRAMDSSRLAEVMRAAAPLLRDIRQAEMRRGPLSSPIPDALRLPPIAAQSVESFNGDVQLVSAALVQPDRRATISKGVAPIVLVAKRFDNKVVMAIGQRFLLAGPQIAAPMARNDRDHGLVVLRNRDGRSVAALRWSLHQPGSALLRKTLPASIFFGLVLAGLIAAIGYRAKRLAKNLVASEARATHLAFHDVLTGLPNRGRFDAAYDRIRRQCAHDGLEFSILAIDLDQFKSVNDTLGHQAGDELIGQIARRLERHCTERDFLARFGGDEFVLIRVGGSQAAIASLSQKLIEEIAEPVRLQAGQVFVGASIGIAHVNSDLLNAPESLRRADLALYAAKDAGRNCHRFYAASMDHNLRNRQELQVRLRDALQEERLSLHYQPQVDESGKLIGAEALVRWFDPVVGHVDPSLFVQVAEETGLIDQLGRFTVRQAFVDSHRWPGLPIAINVSAVQLRSRGFAIEMNELALEHGADPSQFELEITENILVGDDPQTLATLHDLRLAGFKIALDDFGTGYSSLSYLQRYPIDKVKIDRSFVTRLGSDHQAEAVVAAIVQLASAFGLAVVAEGVETDAQRKCLKSVGCTDIQGFLTGHPVPAGELAKLVNTVTAKIWARA